MWKCFNFFILISIFFICEPSAFADCSIATDGIDFGDLKSKDVTGNIVISCSQETTDTFCIGIGLMPGETYNQRFLSKGLAGSSLVSFDLYTDANYSTVWRGGVDEPTKAMCSQMTCGNGDKVCKLNVYGKIVTNDLLPYGVYKDIEPIILYQKSPTANFKALNDTTITSKVNVPKICNITTNPLILDPYVATTGIPCSAPYHNIINVNCNGDFDYHVWLDNHGSYTNHNRFMRNKNFLGSCPSSNCLRYELYKGTDGNCANPWYDDSKSVYNQPQATYDVKAAVLPNQDVLPGDYSDTVTVTVDIPLT